MMVLEIGKTSTIKNIIEENDIQAFANISGDYNPAHTNDEYARKSVFGRRIAHGMLSASYISAVLGTKMPGPGTIYLHQDLDFKKPVYIGDEITTIVEVAKILNPEKGIYELKTKCVNQNGDIVVDGTAVVKYIEENIHTSDFVDKKSNTFYSEEELAHLGLKKYGKNVLISRNAILYSPEKLEVGNDVRIDDFTTISGNVKLGSFIHIAQFCGLYGGDEGIIMEDFSGLSSKVTIYATSNDYSGNSMTNPMVPAKYKPGDKEAKVVLEKHVIVGVNSVILPGVEIGEGSSVGAMSMCAKSLEPWGIYVGAPAKKIKDRSKKLLELEKQFIEERKFLGGGTDLSIE
ncbi:MAG: hypothetical protein E7273_07915 [Pseudobutyrivibrio ruminis]|nr:hypothetical protein [Pseudobutyrivibrio ruminis]